MRSAYCYLPILRAKEGEFHAVGSLSPVACSRLVPLFDVPSPVPRDGKTFEAYLLERAEGIYKSWHPTRPVYVDVHDLPPDLHTSSGAQPITHLFELLRMHSLLTIPVTGTEADRGRDYLAAVGAIVTRDRRGACLRLAEDDLSEPQVLGVAIANVLEQLAIEPSALDVVLDFRYVGTRRADALRSIALEALQAIQDAGSFRNLAIGGSSVPDMLGKRDHGKVRREQRIEFDLWTQLAAPLAERTPIALADYGAIGAHYVPPSKPVNVPARIRYATLAGHAFYRGKCDEYLEICKQLVASDDFMGENFSAGDRRIDQCAKGIVGLGNPASWVAADTNHHLELVSDQAWRFLEDSRLATRFFAS